MFQPVGEQVSKLLIISSTIEPDIKLLPRTCQCEGLANDSSMAMEWQKVQANREDRDRKSEEWEQGKVCKNWWFALEMKHYV